MVGFVKELVDEQAAGSIAMGRKGEFRLSKFEKLVITPGVVFVTKTAPTLSASPNPVPAGEGEGKTTISWNSVAGKIYVSVDGGDEVLFADAPRGLPEADWINAGPTYEFRLCNADHNELLEKLVVQKQRHNGGLCRGPACRCAAKKSTVDGNLSAWNSHTRPSRATSYRKNGEFIFERE